MWPIELERSKGPTKNRVDAWDREDVVDLVYGVDVLDLEHEGDRRVGARDVVAEGVAVAVGAADADAAAAQGRVLGGRDPRGGHPQRCGPGER